MPTAAPRQVLTTPIVEWDDGRLHRRQDEVVVEEPLEIRVKGRPVSVTMRTPGHDAELAIGFLLTEGLIAARDDVRGIEDGQTMDDAQVLDDEGALDDGRVLDDQRALDDERVLGDGFADWSRPEELAAMEHEGGPGDEAGGGDDVTGRKGGEAREVCETPDGRGAGRGREGHDGRAGHDRREGHDGRDGRDGPEGRERRTRRESNLIDVALRVGVEVDFERLSRHVFAASSCGICGKASIDAIRAQRLTPPTRDVRLDPAVLRSMPDVLRAGQTVFGLTGGLHAAGLFDVDGRMLAIREDIGRHNAVDKIIGHALMTGQPLTRAVLLVSGRGGFEIIQKALVAGIPIVAAVSAPSSLAVQLARELGQTLIGFLRGTRFVIYAGEERVIASSERG